MALHGSSCVAGSADGGEAVQLGAQLPMLVRFLLQAGPSRVSRTALKISQSHQKAFKDDVTVNPNQVFSSLQVLVKHTLRERSDVKHVCPRLCEL
jgi:hypothetical protein